MIEQQNEWRVSSVSSNCSENREPIDETHDLATEKVRINLRPVPTKSTSRLARATAISGQPNQLVEAADRPVKIAAGQSVPRASLAHVIAKRVFDVIGAVSILVLTLPVFIGIAIAIRLTGSPVIFAHERVGKGRVLFKCYKFRSMIPDAERALQELLRSSPEVLREWRENHKLKDDPRITPFGEFLRRSSLDELPQLWNVIKGEMSLVGPRPIVADELERFGNKVNMYCSVKPGMTGLWQVMGRSSVTYSQRVSMDVFYAKKHSIGLDIWILFRTIFVVIKRVGAH